MNRVARHVTLVFTFMAAMFAGRTAVAQDRSTGILLMAHGGSAGWNDQVRAVAAETDKQMPTEVAFGMADRSTLQQGVDALTKRGLAADRVAVRGYGAALPVADNATPEGREKNRRIVFSVNAG